MVSKLRRFYKMISTGITEIEHDHTQERIPRIDVRGLPKYNFISLFMEYIGDQRSYHEYNYINGKSMIVAAALGRVTARTQGIQGSVFPRPLKINDMNLIIGYSGTGKSISHDESRSMLENFMGKDIFIPKAAPETVAKELADFKIITRPEQPKTKGRRSKKGEDEDSEDSEPEETTTKQKEIEIEIELPAAKYPRCWRTFWRGEFGSFLAEMNKTYMAGITEDFCDYYSGNIETKIIKGDSKLSNVKFMFRDDLFFALNGSMTPISLTYLTIEMIKKGLVRFTFYDGSDLPLKEIPQDADIQAIAKKQGDIFTRTEEYKNSLGIKKDDYQKRCLIKCGVILDTLLKNQLVDVDFSEEAAELILNREKAMLRQFGNDRYILMLISRDLEKIYKECIAVELGNIPYYLIANQEKLEDREIRISDTFEDLENTNTFYDKISNFDLSKIDHEHRIRKLIVTPETAKFVLKMFDRIYFPSMLSIVEKIKDQDTNKVNKTTLEKVIKVFTDAPNISKHIVIQMYRDALERFEKQEKAKLEKGDISKDQISEINKKIQENREKTQDEIKYFSNLDDSFIITSLTRRQL
jgi:hypothetical protein